MFSLWRSKAHRVLSSVFNVRMRPHGRVRLVLEMLENRTLPSTLMVTSSADSGPGTLRQAITTADTVTGPTTIDFAIGSGPQTITILNPLPLITAPVILDGTSQPGFSGTPLITIGANYITPAVVGGGITPPPVTSPTVTDALNLFASGSTVEGLEISGFINGDGIAVTGNNETVGGTKAGAGNVITGNQSGIVVGGTNNLIAGNLVNESLRDGVDVSGSDSVVEGNLIGTSNIPNGTLSSTEIVPAGANFGNGVSVIGSHNTIGGTTAAARNVISNNHANGVNVNSRLFSDNIIEGNYIGTNAAGSAALPNALMGIVDSQPPLPPGFEGPSGPSDTTIGGSAAGAGNLISGNGIYGIMLLGGGTTILDNKIGTDAVGTVAVPNAYDGIYAYGAGGNTISGNLISGNGRFGIFLLGQPTNPLEFSSSFSVVQNNIIGLGQGGAPLPNTDDGVALFAGATNNTIGGTAPGTGNLISGNGRFGIYLNGVNTTDNLIEGNRIGTSADGSAAEGNKLDGIAVFVGPAANTIGGTAAGAGNVISGNNRDGVYLANAGAGNVLAGNIIGLGSDGSTALGNNGNGVAVQAVSGTTIGGTSSGAGNVISGNIEGVVIIGAGATGNLLEGNFIGTDKPGAPPPNPDIGDPVNQAFGVDIQGGASGNTVGGTTSGAGNTIAFFGEAGMIVGNSPADTTTVGNAILGNSIFISGGNIEPAFSVRLGIDLGHQLTSNGPGGAARSGPNDLPNYPVLASAVVNADGTVTLTCSFTSVASATFRLEFFLSSADINPVQGHTYQGRTFLGTVDATTDASGNLSAVTGSGSVTGGVARITLTPPAGVTATPGLVVTSTATLTKNSGKAGSGTVGDTSEFSQPLALAAAAAG